VVVGPSAIVEELTRTLPGCRVSLKFRLSLNKLRYRALPSIDLTIDTHPLCSTGRWFVFLLSILKLRMIKQETG